MTLIIVSILVTLVFIAFIVCISDDKLFTLASGILIAASATCLGGAIENYRLTDVTNENKDNVEPDVTYIVLKGDTIKSEDVVILKTLNK